jgi:hypothetical protein
MIARLFGVAALALSLALSSAADARQHRSHAVRDAFCTETASHHCKRPGYVVDSCGAKAKDKRKRKGCYSQRRRGGP